MAAIRSTSIKSSISIIDDLTANPGDFLSSQKSRDTKITKVLKNLFDSSKSFVNHKKSIDSLPELIVTGFDEEQIWQQLELENDSNISSLLSTSSTIISKKSSLTFNSVASTSSTSSASNKTSTKTSDKNNVSDSSNKKSKKGKKKNKSDKSKVTFLDDDSDSYVDSDIELSAIDKRYNKTVDQDDIDDKFFDFTGDSDEDLNFDFGPLGQGEGDDDDDLDEELFKADVSDDEQGGEIKKKNKKSVTFEDSEKSDDNAGGKNNKIISKKTQSILKKSTNKAKSVVDDKFFKLSQLEEFLDEEDRKEERKLKREQALKDNRDVDDDDEDDDGADDIDLFAEIDSGDDDCHYDDFFDPPDDDASDDADVDCDDDENIDHSFDDEVGDNGDEYDEEGDFNNDVEADESSDLHMLSKLGQRKDLLADCESEGEDVTDILGGKKEVKSSFEIRQEKLKKKMSAIEKDMLSEKAWQMSGETDGSKRPENSLLQERLQFDQATRLPPEITEETTKTLEDLIKQRIKDKAWDDVERKVKPKENPFEYKKRVTLDQEKSKLSLGEIYEQEYLKQQQTEEVEKKDPDHENIKKSLQSLFIKLDALSNFHYTPKQATADIVVVTNQPSIAMEEVAPISMSESKTLAPEEIQDKVNDEVKGSTEKTKTDKMRERKKKKKHQRVKEKQKQQRQKLIEKLNPGLGNKYSKEKALKELENASKSGNSGVKMLKEDSKGRSELTSSKAFFTQLQEEVVTNIGKKKGQKRKGDSNTSSVKKFKL
ncbi:u3 small nucleolar ribonucleoprotein MPP10 [Mactra antiquata]